MALTNPSKSASRFCSCTGPERATPRAKRKRRKGALRGHGRTTPVRDDLFDVVRKTPPPTESYARAQWSALVGEGRRDRPEFGGLQLKVNRSQENVVERLVTHHQAARQDALDGVVGRHREGHVLRYVRRVLRGHLLTDIRYLRVLRVLGVVQRVEDTAAHLEDRVVRVEDPLWDRVLEGRTLGTRAHHGAPPYATRRGSQCAPHP